MRTLGTLLLATLGILGTAQDGTPDLNYGEDGMAHTFICMNCQCSKWAAFDPQGRVVLGGRKRDGPYPADVYAARYTADGQVDSAYGEYGVAYGLFCTSSDVVSDMAIGADGSVFLCGHEDFGPFEDGQAAVLKWDPTGQLDTSFGQNQGTYGLQLGAHTYFYGMALQADGKIVLSGNYSPVSMRAMLHRLNVDGTPDTTFGISSSVLPDPPGTSDMFGKVAVQPDGRILATLYYTGHVELQRYMPDGTLDASFATNGAFTIGTTGSVEYPGIYLLPDGRITCFVFLGGGFVENVSYHRVVRLLPDGTPDPTFGGDGVVDLPAPETNGSFTAMLPDGRLLIANGPSPNTGVRCLANDGTWDSDFGIDGVALPVAPVLDGSGAIAVGPDQRFVMATAVESDIWYAQEPDVAVVMFHADSLWNLTSVVPGQEPADEAGLIVYPSPVHAGQSVTVEYPHAVSVECIAADGRSVVITSDPWGTSRVQLATDKLPAGIYMLYARDAKGRLLSNSRLVVQ
jgi:uncharacterized delta-60 repeat protein